MRLPTPSFLVGLVLTVSCGSSDPTPTGNSGANGPVKATINGQAWASGSSAAAVRTSPGQYSLSALSLTNDYSLTFFLYNIGGTGIYPLGNHSSLSGGMIVVSKPATSGWMTPLTGAAGQIEITALTATRIAGTFSFTGTPVTGTGNLAVTNGTFDVPVTGSVAFGTLPDNLGGRFALAVNGTSSGVGGVGSILTTGTPPTLVIVAAGERTMSIRLTNMTGAGTYTLSATGALRSIELTGSPTSQTATWASQPAGGSGSVTITSVTATRIVGSYSATLVPTGGGATGNLTVSGTFDFGRGATF